MDKHMDEVMEGFDKKYKSFRADANDLRVSDRFVIDSIPIACRSYARKVVEEIWKESRKYEMKTVDGNITAISLVDVVNAYDRLTDKETP